jgi:hypothetical protein
MWKVIIGVFILKNNLNKYTVENNILKKKKFSRKNFAAIVILQFLNIYP